MRHHYSQPPSPTSEHRLDKHAGHRAEVFLQKFWASLLLTIVVVLYSPLPQKLFGWQAPVFAGSSLIPLIFGSIVFFYGGWVFLIGAGREIKHRLPGMMTLIALAISAAYLFSLAVTLLNQGETLFWELTTLITIMLLGHYLEMRAVAGTQNALAELAKLIPNTAEVVRSDGTTEKVPLAEIREGDLVLVRPGGQIPVDGVVVKGESEVNEALATGESKPVAKKKNDEVIAGTLNADGVLTIKVSKIGEKTFLAGVMKLISEAQSTKSRLQILSDRAAFYLTVVALGAGALTLIVWLSLASPVFFAVERLVAVLVIACPHALGLAVPLVASISTSMAAQNGFLVRDRLALEKAREIEAILIDKTGTLTKGEFGLEKIWSFTEQSEDEILRLAASVDANSEHPVAKAVVNAAKSRGLSLLPVEKFTKLPGAGSRAEIENQELRVGGRRIINELDLTVPAHKASEIEMEQQKGKTIIFVVQEQVVLGALSLADQIRPESKEAISELRKMGLKVAMLTGDSEHVAAWVASELYVNEFFAQVKPEEKVEKVKLLQERGLKVAMVGDGMNDAPALTQADLGVAIGAGTNVAIESAGIILIKNDPRDVVKIIRLSRLTYSKMLQNLFWATGYNLVALPLAAGVLFSQGIVLQPALAAVLMSLSTIIVALNALSLRKAEIRK